MEQEGKFIAIYGINNLGKTRQATILKEALEGQGLETIGFKYPIYDLEPTGPEINAVLRQGVPMQERDLQGLYARNRRDFEPTLLGHLSRGKWVVAEDYTGTGIAWGMAGKIPLLDLEKMNSGLLQENLAILLYGERFLQSREENHRNEADDVKCERARVTHLFLAERYGWKKVFASQSWEEVHRDIWQIVAEKFNLKNHD